MYYWKDCSLASGWFRPRSIANSSSAASNRVWLSILFLLAPKSLKSAIYDFLYLVLKLSYDIKWKSRITLGHCYFVGLSCCSLEASLDWQLALQLCLENTSTSKHPKDLGGGEWKVVKGEKHSLDWIQAKFFNQVSLWLSTGCEAITASFELLGGFYLDHLAINQGAHPVISSFVFFVLGPAVSFFTGLCPTSSLSSHRVQHIVSTQ